VLIDLLPQFLEVLAAPDPELAYHQYHQRHQAVLDAYWRNYVVEPGSELAAGIVRNALAADRTDLRELLAQRDLRGTLEPAIERTCALLGIDRPTDVYLMVGMGGANAGELVVGGRGAVVLCLEHFTGRPNTSTHGLGLSPDLLPLWAAHELAHTARYTATDSRSEMSRLVAEAGGYYDYWATGSRATLRELLVNEGLAVHASMLAAPGHEPGTYLGYIRRQYLRLRELETVLRRAVAPDLDARALGLRLRYLSGGTSPAARLVQGRVIPERAGYYLGSRMTSAAVDAMGIRRALRATAEEITAAENLDRGVQSA
jgi:hypothetical protein